MKVLLVKTSSLGDIIQTFPALEYLYARGCQVDWVVEAPHRELVESHPCVHSVHSINSKAWRRGRESHGLRTVIRTLRCHPYDLLIDLQGNVKSMCVNLIARAKTKIGFGMRTVPEWPNLISTNFKVNPSSGSNVRGENLELAQAYFGDRTPFASEGIRLKISPEEEASLEKILEPLRSQAQAVVLFCPGSAWKNKQMTPVDLKEFISLILKTFPCRFLFGWGNDHERQLAEELQREFPEQSQIIERQRLPVLQNLMAKVDLVIAMDSLPLHLAGTTPTPTFGIFGASSAQKYNPQGEKHGYFQGGCAYGLSFSRRCPNLRTCATGACIREIDVSALFQRFSEFYHQVCK